jgi:hypothetical protein
LQKIFLQPAFRRVCIFTVQGRYPCIAEQKNELLSETSACRSEAIGRARADCRLKTPLRISCPSWWVWPTR